MTTAREALDILHRYSFGREDEITHPSQIGGLVQIIYDELNKHTPKVIERHDLVMPIYDETEPQGEPYALCGDWPAPCNCDDPTTHDGSVPASLVRGEQGEPSDAHTYNPDGKTIAATVDWVKRNYAYRPGQDDEYVGQIIDALEAAHAALRAAGAVAEVPGQGREETHIQYGHLFEKLGWVPEYKGKNYSTHQRTIKFGPITPIEWEDRVPKTGPDLVREALAADGGTTPSVQGWA